MGIFAKAQKDPGAQNVQFLQDQTGPFESVIIEKMSELFRDVPQVEEAFFARVIAHGHQEVALCVAGSPEMDTQQVLRGVSQVYGRLVKSEQGLHTIFLTAAQRVEIAKTCHAFYKSPALR